MFDSIIEILPIVFKPLFNTSKDAILQISKPRRKMVKSILKLYEDLENVEYYSSLLFKNIEYYINNKKKGEKYKQSQKRNLLKTSEKLRRPTNKLGESLSDVSILLKIEQSTLLENLRGLYGAKGDFFLGRITPIPKVIKSNEDQILILQPQKHITQMNVNEYQVNINEVDQRLDTYIDPNLSRGNYEAIFLKKNLDKIKKNFFKEINLDNLEKSNIETQKLLNKTRYSLTIISQIKEQLRDFIENNLTIEDYFR